MVGRSPFGMAGLRRRKRQWFAWDPSMLWDRLQPRPEQKPTSGGPQIPHPWLTLTGSGPQGSQAEGLSQTYAKLLPFAFCKQSNYSADALWPLSNAHGSSLHASTLLPLPSPSAVPKTNGRLANALTIWQVSCLPLPCKFVIKQQL